LNTSESYARSAADWEGDFLFVIQPDAAYQQAAFLYIDVQKGVSPSAMQVASLEEKPAMYTISASYSIWRKALEGKRQHGADATQPQSHHRIYSLRHQNPDGIRTINSASHR
jgi:putative sterol carrier protein